MAAAMAELGVSRINPVGGALRLGVLHDLLGRTEQRRPDLLARALPDRAVRRLPVR